MADTDTKTATAPVADAASKTTGPSVANTSQADTSSTGTITTAKNGAQERPVFTRSTNSAPVFDADQSKLAAQSNGNTGADLAKPAPTPTHATAVGMLMTSWSEMKLKFADFDHELDMSDPAEAELQDVIDFLRNRV